MKLTILEFDKNAVFSLILQEPIKLHQCEVKVIADIDKNII